MSGTKDSPQSRHVIFLNGPIGIGKTVLGRRVAVELGAAFIDSDDLGDASKRWFEQVLRVSRALVHTGLAALRDRPVLIVAKPLRARDWLFFRRHFEASGVAVYCITLTAQLCSILGPDRGRTFDREEQARIKEMMEQGYADRSFSHAFVATDREGIAEAAAALAAECRRLLDGGRRVVYGTGRKG